MIAFSAYLPYIYWFLLVLLFVLLFVWWVHSKTYWWDFVKWFVEWIYSFFDDLVTNPKLEWVKTFSVVIFFIIFAANLWSLLVDMMKMAIPGLDKVIVIPTTDIHFPLLLAIMSIGYMLLKQVQAKGLWNTLHAYLPVTWSDIIPSTYEDVEGVKKTSIGAKIGDVFMSLFMGILDIVWLFAKIISLSFRLTWNIFSWGVLMWIAVWWLWVITSKLVWISVPLWIPVLLVLQSLLVWFIQAFVFALLVSIFINMATEE